MGLGLRHHFRPDMTPAQLKGALDAILFDEKRGILAHIKKTGRPPAGTDFLEIRDACRGMRIPVGVTEDDFTRLWQPLGYESEPEMRDAIRQRADAGGGAVNVSMVATLNSNVLFPVLNTAADKAMDENADVAVGNELVDDFDDTKQTTTVPERYGQSAYGLVKENDPLPRAQVTDDYTIIGLAKYGEEVTVTYEAVAGDNTGLVLSGLAMQMRLAVAKNARFVIERILDRAPTMPGVGDAFVYKPKSSPTGTALYSASARLGADNGNLLAKNPLNNEQNIRNVRQLMRKMYFKDKGNVQPKVYLGVTPDQLLVPDALRDQAIKILGSNLEYSRSTDTGGNVVYNAVNPYFNNIKVLSSPVIDEVAADASSWWAGQFKRQFLRKTRRKLQAERLTAGVSDEMFDRDLVMKGRILCEFEVGAITYQFVVKNTAT